MNMADEKLIALTFDDGPNTVTTPRVLDILEKYCTVGSFFLVGNCINDESARAAERANKMGCEICNHSRTHAAMPELSPEEIRSEIEYTSKLCEAISGYTPAFFRPPYIAVNDVMFDNIDLPFICGYGCNDWVDTVSVDERVERVLAQACHGAIILLHDYEGNEKTVEALDKIIPALRSEGYSFVTVSDLFMRCGVEPKKGIVYSCVFDK